MSIWGKVLLGLIVPLAIVAMVLMAKFVTIRGSWLQQLERLKAENQANAESLTERREELVAAQAKLQRVTQSWPRIWLDVDVQPAPGRPDVLVMAIGANDGVTGAAQGDEVVPTILPFRRMRNGDYIFVGPFRSHEPPQPSNWAVEPEWILRSGEEEDWVLDPQRPELSSWDVRRGMPANYLTEFRDVQQKLISADTLLADKQRYLQINEQALASAEENLEFRNNELLGNPGNPNNVGLIKRTETAAKERDATLKTVDDLRRQMVSALDERQQLVNEINDLSKQLPK